MPLDLTASRLSLPAARRRTGHIHRAEIRASLSLAAPIALVALVNMAMSLTDTLMAAAFGAEALAAVAVGSDFYSIVFYFMAGTVSGLGPVYATALACGDAAAASRLRRAGWLVAALCAAFAVPAVWFAPSYLAAAGLESGLLAEGAGYTRLMALTLLPMLVVALFRTRLSAEERPGLLLRVTLAAVPLNAALNGVLMFGIAPWPGMGITGAGLSSLLVAGFIATLLAILGRSRAPGPAAAPRPGEILAVLRSGMQIGVATVAEVGIFLGATLFAATLGAAEVAAHAVAIRAAGLAYALPSGLLQAAMVRSARAVEGLAARRAVIATSLMLAGAAGVVLCALLVLSAGAVAGLIFDTTPEGRAAAGRATALLVLLGVMQLCDPAASVASGILRGRGDTRAPMLFTLFGFWAIGAPLLLYLGQEERLGILGVWIALAVGTAMAAALSLARLGRHWRA